MTDAEDNLNGDGMGDATDTTQPSTDTGGDGRPAWMAQLPDDLKAHEGLAKFETIGDASKALLDAQGKLESTIKIPGEKATIEEMDDFFTQLGRPKTPDGYDLSDVDVPATLEIDPAPIRQKAHELGVTENQLKGMAKVFLDVYANDEKMLLQAIEENDKRNKEILDKAWGDKAEAKENAVKGLLRKVGAQLGMQEKEIGEYLENADFNRDALMKIMLAQISEGLSEDSVFGAEGSGLPRKDFPKDEFGRYVLTFPNTPGMSGNPE